MVVFVKGDQRQYSESITSNPAASIHFRRRGRPHRCSVRCFVFVVFVKQEPSCYYGARSDESNILKAKEMQERLDKRFGLIEESIRLETNDLGFE